MTRTATTEPLVEKDDDGSYVPAGRQLGPDRTDGRDHHGLTSAEETAYQFAVDRLNNTPNITPASHISVDEEERMFHEVGFTSTTPIAQKDGWVALYRTLHPLPTAYSELPADDPALCVPESAIGPTDAVPPITQAESVPPVATSALAASLLADTARVLTEHQATEDQSITLLPALTAPRPAPVSTPAQPTRTFSDLAAAMDTLGTMTGREQKTGQNTAPGVTPAPAPSAPAASPFASTLNVAISTAVQVVEFAEAHPDAVEKLGNILRRLFQHAA